MDLRGSNSVMQRLFWF